MTAAVLAAFTACAVVILFLFYLYHRRSYQWSAFDFSIYRIIEKKVDVVFYKIMDLLFGGEKPY